MWAKEKLTCSSARAVEKRADLRLVQTHPFQIASQHAQEGSQLPPVVDVLRNDVEVAIPEPLRERRKQRAQTRHVHLVDARWAERAEDVADVA